MKTPSDSKVWAGFQPKAHYFADAAWNVPLREVVGGAQKPTTVGDAYLDLCFEGSPGYSTTGRNVHFQLDD